MSDLSEETTRISVNIPTEVSTKLQIIPHGMRGRLYRHMFELLAQELERDPVTTLQQAVVGQLSINLNTGDSDGPKE